MCYDISFTVNIAELSDYFPGLVFDDQMDINFGGFDHVQGVSVFAPHPIIYVDRDKLVPHCQMMEWSCMSSMPNKSPTLKKGTACLTYVRKGCWMMLKATGIK